MDPFLSLGDCYGVSSGRVRHFKRERKKFYKCATNRSEGKKGILEIYNHPARPGASLQEEKKEILQPVKSTISEALKVDLGNLIADTTGHVRCVRR